jgi:hypothetical protein
VSDQSQNPEQPENSAPVDRPAALEPDPPTLAHSMAEQASPESDSDSASPSEPAADTSGSPASVPAPTVATGSVPAPTVATGSAPAPPEVSLPPRRTEATTAALADRPELAVGAAFAGGLVFALILKRLAR